MEKHCEPYIYKITNLINGKVYIGQHNAKRSNYYTSGSYIKKAIKKYGKDNFKREIIVQGDFNQELLNQLEIHYIRLFCSFVKWNRDGGYNLTEGGGGVSGLDSYNKKAIYRFDLDGNIVGEYESVVHASNELNISTANIIDAANFNKKRYMGSGFIWIYKQDFTEDLLNKKIDLAKNKYRLKSKNVLEFDKKGNFIREWECAGDIIEEFNYHKSNFRNHCAGKGSVLLYDNKIFLHKSLYEENKDILFKRLSRIKKNIDCNNRRIGKYSKESGELLKVYENTNHILLKYGAKARCNISNTCHGKQKSALGFYWRFI